jgi:hypothetical protein
MTPISRVTISTASFYYWYNSRIQLESMRRRLELLLVKEVLQGLEFSLTIEQLQSWENALTSGAKCLPFPFHDTRGSLVSRILDLPSNSVHLPLIHGLSDQGLSALATSIGKIYSATRIVNYIIHPDEVPPSSWKLLDRSLPEGVSLCIENMDPRKRAFRTLSEIDTLVQTSNRFKVTLDTSHWLECGHSLQGSEVLTFLENYRSRIASIHLSVPSSSSRFYLRSPEISTSHYFAYNSGVVLPSSFFTMLNPDTIITLEGVVPLQHFSGIMDDAQLARYLMDGASEEKIAS